MSAPVAKKSYGQHFLINEGIIQKITDRVFTMSRDGKDPVIEIGPGPGPLTRALLDRGLRVTAIELDPRMVEHLQGTMKDFIEKGQLKLIHADAMRFSMQELHKEIQSDCVVCGNLPYNVGTHILFRFLEDFPLAKSFCFMLQKELIQRLISPHKNKTYGGPSVKLAWSTKILDHFWVSRGSFAPPPRVESGVVSFRRLEKPLADPLLRDGSYDKASKFVEKAFMQRRKMLRGIFPRLTASVWATKRAEELSPQELLDLGLSD